jgi:hypothetical protein
MNPIQEILEFTRSILERYNALPEEWEHFKIIEDDILFSSEMLQYSQLKDK